jgi:nicotinamidase-related amidase
MTTTDTTTTDTAAAAASPAPARRALIVVDAQNDFVDPDGALSVAGAVARLDNVNALVAAAEAAGMCVVYTADMHPEVTPHFDRHGGPWPEHCVAGTWGAMLHPRLRVADGALHVHKGTGDEDGYSGFSMTGADGTTFGTGLDELLRERGVRTIIVAGFATDYCVSATAVDGAGLGYDTVFVVDAAAAVNLEPGDGDAAVARMVDAGVNVASTAQALVEIDGAAQVAA